MHTPVWPLPHRPVQLGWTCQVCDIPTDVALGVIEARKPSHQFKVHALGDGIKAVIAVPNVGESDIKRTVALFAGNKRVRSKTYRK